MEQVPGWIGFSVLMGSLSPTKDGDNPAGLLIV